MKPKYKLRSLLLLTTAVALLSASFLPAIVERKRAASLRGTGVQIYTEPRGQHLLRQIFGDSISQRVVYVHLDDPAIDDAWLRKLTQFPYIEVLSIKSPNITDAGLTHLTRLPNLTSLNLVNTQSTQEGIDELRQSSARLQRVESREDP